MQAESGLGRPAQMRPERSGAPRGPAQPASSNVASKEAMVGLVSAPAIGRGCPATALASYSRPVDPALPRSTG